MFNPSSTTLIRNCCYFFMLIFITSTCAYIIDSNELRNSLAEQQFGLHAPSYADRYIRTTKFPRIGRSPSDLEENVEFDSNIRFDEIDDNNENEIRLLEQRSVLFPRIGKRAFHNIIWGNSYSNPHRTLDSQGRYHINGYDYQPYPNYSPPVTHVRGKRNLSS